MKNNILYYVIDDALRDGGIGGYMSKGLIVKHIRNIIMKTTNGVVERIKSRDNIYVMIYDFVADADKPLLQFIGGCFQKLEGRRLMYSSVHQLITQSGRVVVVAVVE